MRVPELLLIAMVLNVRPDNGESERDGHVAARAHGHSKSGRCSHEQRMKLKQQIKKVPKYKTGTDKKIKKLISA